jgi:hypothetical protein
MKAGNSSSTTDQVVPLERPTGSATLTISLGPAKLGGTAKGTQAHHLITTFGIAGSALVGVGGAVLTIHVATSLTALALAEVGLAFAAMVLITVCRWPWRRKIKSRAISENPAGLRPRRRRSL